MIRGGPKKAYGWRQEKQKQKRGRGKMRGREPGGKESRWYYLFIYLWFIILFIVFKDYMRIPNCPFSVDHYLELWISITFYLHYINS